MSWARQPWGRRQRHDLPPCPKVFIREGDILNRSLGKAGHVLSYQVKINVRLNDCPGETADSLQLTTASIQEGLAALQGSSSRLLEDSSPLDILEDYLSDCQNEKGVHYLLFRLGRAIKAIPARASKPQGGSSSSSSLGGAGDGAGIGTGARGVG